MMLDVHEHTSPKYPPRTWANAARADLTTAFALDFSTGGEVLTKRAAGAKYIGIKLATAPITAAMYLIDFRDRQSPRATLNIAGNGMHTLGRHLWTQDRVNRWVYHTLKPVHEHEPIKWIFTGGQTGVDIAGAVAAVKLEIPCTVNMPRGLIQRDSHGYDAPHSQEEIIAQITQGVTGLDV
jgi:hypothetical protein